MRGHLKYESLHVALHGKICEYCKGPSVRRLFDRDVSRSFAVRDIRMLNNVQANKNIIFASRKIK